MMDIDLERAERLREEFANKKPPKPLFDVDDMSRNRLTRAERRAVERVRNKQKHK